MSSPQFWKTIGKLETGFIDKSINEHANDANKARAHQRISKQHTRDEQVLDRLEYPIKEVF